MTMGPTCDAIFVGGDNGDVMMVNLSAPPRTVAVSSETQAWLLNATVADLFWGHMIKGKRKGGGGKEEKIKKISVISGEKCIKKGGDEIIVGTPVLRNCYCGKLNLRT